MHHQKLNRIIFRAQKYMLKSNIKFKYRFLYKSHLKQPRDLAPKPFLHINTQCYRLYFNN